MSVQIPGLPVASIANDADTTIIRQGLTDKQVTVDKVRSIDILLQVESENFKEQSRLDSNEYVGNCH